MKLKHIDSIRGVAILLVVLVHVSQRISGLFFLSRWIADYGQMGVQLFFVASAYTLCLSAKFRETEDQKFMKYGIRRFFRIAPLYYLGLFGYFLLSVFKLFKDSGHIVIPSSYTFKNVMSNVLFVHGFYEPGNNTIVPGGWSIGTEMAFYLVFPFLFGIANNKINESVRRIIIWILAGLILSQVGLQIFLLSGMNMANNTFVYYNLINQLPVFFIGMGYYFINPQKSLNYKWTIDLVVFIVLTALSVYLWRILQINYLFSIIPFISGLSFLCLIEIFRKVDVLNHPFLIRIGKVSFSMYIIHFVFAYTVSGKVLPKLLNVVNSELILVLLFVFSALASFILALLSEKLIEKPFVKLGKKIILNVKNTANNGVYK